MGSPNQQAYLTQRIPKSPGRILEVGSRDYSDQGGGVTQNFRQWYGGAYVGVDMEAGRGVDVVQDLSQGIGPLERGSFDLIICCSVLEHVRKPWLMADNLTDLLAPHGQLYIAVPWVWRYHPYPDDYFRFSWRGVEALFERLQWRDLLFSTTKVDEFFPAQKDEDNRRSGMGDGRKYLPYLEIHGMGTKP